MNSNYKTIIPLITMCFVQKLYFLLDIDFGKSYKFLIKNVIRALSRIFGYNVLFDNLYFARRIKSVKKLLSFRT